jgi:RNA polymerase sigma factor (sigma-70 family)
MTTLAPMGWSPSGLQARDGSSSFAVWFPQLLPLAYNVGYRFRTGDTAFAEDVAQEALTRAFASWERIRSHPNLEAWVTTTASHVALELSRQRQRAARADPSQQVAVHGDEDRVVDVDVLANALRRLSQRQQQVLVWRYYFDQSVSQTAERLGLTESKVKDATHEAVTKLGGCCRESRAQRDHRRT